MEDYVTFEQAVKLKELGFDWKCYTFYHRDNWCGLSHSGICENHNMFGKCVSAPTLSQTQKWLREVKDICVMPIKCTKIGNSIDGKYYSEIRAMDGKMIQCSFQVRETYEEALSIGIDEALKLIKNK